MNSVSPTVLVDRPKALVLVLEDQPVLMIDMVDHVETAGCEAVAVSDTAEAITILETRTDIRVVLTDLDVRGSVMGMKLVAMIRDRWPPIELILTSSAPHPPATADMPARSVYFDKPVDGHRLVAAIKSFVASV